jgi:hypothetical protein
MSVPARKVITYTNDVSSGRYLKDSTITPFAEVLESLGAKQKLDKLPRKAGSDMMLSGPTRNKVRNIQPMLIPTGVEVWSLGGHPDIYVRRDCHSTVASTSPPMPRGSSCATQPGWRSSVASTE